MLQLLDNTDCVPSLWLEPATLYLKVKHCQQASRADYKTMVFQAMDVLHDYTGQSINVW